MGIRSLKSPGKIFTPGPKIEIMKKTLILVKIYICEICFKKFTELDSLRTPAYLRYRIHFSYCEKKDWEEDLQNFHECECPPHPALRDPSKRREDDVKECNNCGQFCNGITEETNHLCCICFGIDSSEYCFFCQIENRIAPLQYTS